MRNAALAVIIASGAFVSTVDNVHAEAKTCALDGIRLNCGDRRATRADYFQRFSNPKTTQALNAELSRFPLFENGRQREAYRRSLERVWRAVTRHGREQKRRYLRRQLSKATYTQIEADFEQARKSYDAAINLYRHHIWKPEGSITRVTGLND